jgi:hypothetical protein
MFELNPLITFSLTEGTKNWQLISKLAIIIIMFANLLLLVKILIILASRFSQMSEQPRDWCNRTKPFAHTSFTWKYLFFLGMDLFLFLLAWRSPFILFRCSIFYTESTHDSHWWVHIFFPKLNTDDFCLYPV